LGNKNKQSAGNIPFYFLAYKAIFVEAVDYTVSITLLHFCWQPRTPWEDYIEDIGWNCLEFHQSEMLEELANRNVWRQSWAAASATFTDTSGFWKKKKYFSPLFVTLSLVFLFYTSNVNVL